MLSKLLKKGVIEMTQNYKSEDREMTKYRVFEIISSIDKVRIKLENMGEHELAFNVRLVQATLLKFIDASRADWAEWQRKREVI